MFQDKMVACKVCGKEMDILGLPSHMTRIHHKEYDSQKIFWKKCQMCDNLISQYRKFCSFKCEQAYRKIHKRKTECLYSLKNGIPENIKKEIMAFAKDHITTKKEIILKFNISEELLRRIFKEEKILLQKSFKTLEDRIEQGLKKFSESKMSKNLIKEYQEYGGTIRGLSKKYNISRLTLKSQILFSEENI